MKAYKMMKLIVTKKAICMPILLLSPLFLFASCVATQQDILALNRQIQTLSSQINKLEGVREKQADLGVEIDSLRQEAQRLSGVLEESQHLIKHTVERDTLELDTLITRLAGLEKSVTQLYQHLDLKPLTESRQPLATGPKETSGRTPPPQAKDETSDLPEKTLYEETLAAYQDGKYQDAITGFKNLIINYPASSLADNAQFWIGESYMAQKKYELAIRAYHEVITKYPNGNKVPNAMLKQALAFIEARDDVAAKILLKKLMKNYPDSDEAKLAGAKLKSIQ